MTTTSRLKRLLALRSTDRPPRRSRRPTLPANRAEDAAPIADYGAWFAEISQRLRLKQPYAPDDVLARVETYLGCTIDVTTQDWEGSMLYGACCPTGDARYLIALRRDLTTRQRAKTLYHELAHILRGHATPTETTFRCFEPTTRQDIEAEEIARLFVERGSRGRRQSFADRFIERMGGVN